MGEPLLLRTSDCPGVLDRWVGPVVLTLDPPYPAVLVGRENGGGYVHPGPPPMWQIAIDGGPVIITPTTDLALNLSRAECRDRVARWVAGRVSPPQRVTEGVRWRQIGTVADRAAWSLTSDGGDQTQFGAERGWIRVPALAALSPSDPARLPDGCRRVDAEALAVVARFVGGAP